MTHRCERVDGGWSFRTAGHNRIVEIRGRWLAAAADDCMRPPNFVATCSENPQAPAILAGGVVPTGEAHISR